MTPELRTLIYALAAATSPLLVAYGVATDATAALWLAWLETVTAAIVAYCHRPTKLPPIE